MSSSPPRPSTPSRRSSLSRSRTRTQLTSSSSGPPPAGSRNKQLLSTALTQLKMHNGSDAHFGAIRFMGTKRAPAKWVATSVDSDIEDLYRLVTETWNLAPPPVIISVTGAAQNTTMQAREKAIFRRGLRSAAMATNAWIVTGGTNSGVMELVGQTVQEEGEATSNRIVCLGVVPWGAVWRHDEMRRTPNGKVFSYELQKPSAPYAALDPNHSHFILVDDGTDGKFGSDVGVRTALEARICSDQSAMKDPDDDLLPTPMVLVVVSGGVGTLDTIVRTLEQERPVVILSESGGVATLIYRYCEHQAEMERALLDESHEWYPKLGATRDEDRLIVARLQRSLPIVKKLGMQERGANQVKQLRFFSSSNNSEGEGNDLDAVLLDAILSDCDSTVDAIMHAVKWSEPTTIDAQLQISKAVDRKGLTRAFESALIYGTQDENAERVVKTLIDYNADARYVRFDRLFKRSPVDLYGVIEDYKAEKLAKMHGRRRGGREPSLKGSRTDVRVGVSGGLDSVAVDGFELLEGWGKFLGYDDHINCMRTTQRLARTREMRMPSHSPLPPQWNELMMWAVLIGEVRLAELLWRKTINPMRSAVNASRLAMKISDMREAGSDAAEEAEKQSKTYEEWAIGVLDLVEPPEVAMGLLTLVAKKPLPSSTGQSPAEIQVWRDSVMDQACDDNNGQPCMAFVARPNSQYLLDRYYNGDYVGSGCKIDPKSEQSRLIAQILLMLFHGMTLGCFVNILPYNFVPYETPPFQHERQPDEDDANDDDEDWDLEYFDGQIRYESSNGRDDLLANLVSKTQQFWLRWVGFFCIPRVKFCVHTTFYLMYIALYTLIMPLWGSGSLWSWTHRTTTLYAEFPSQLSPSVYIEIALWSYLFGRVCEEAHQVYLLKWAYFREIWNMIDVATVITMLVCFILRMLVWIDSSTASAHADGATISTYVGSSSLGFSHDTRTTMMQYIQVCFGVSTVLVFFRFFDNLSIFPQVGELVTILLSMMGDSGTIIVILLWSGVGFGTAFSGLVPIGASDPQFFTRPFWYGIRAILGDFDLSLNYEQLGDSYSPEQNVMGTAMIVLLWLYAFFTTIYIVNLMIAIMTTQYERIRERSILYRKFRRVSLIIEYKDMRSALPPPFILLDYPIRVIGQVLIGRNPTHITRDAEAMGFLDFMWQHTADKLLKFERDARDTYVQTKKEEDVPRKLADIQTSVNASLDTIMKRFEALTGRCDHIDRQLRQMSGAPSGEKAQGGGGRRGGDGGGGGGSAAYAPPGRLAPLNYVQSGVLPAAYPPAQTAADVAAAGAGGGRARTSAAYLNSVAVIPHNGLPMDSLRPAPRLPSGNTVPIGYSTRAALSASHDDARRVFAAYDRDSSGDIDAAELRAALRDLGLDANSSQTSRIIAKYDTNSDRRLDFVEFSQLLYELRDFQRSTSATLDSTGHSSAAGVPLSPALTPSVATFGGGGMQASGGGYYSPSELAAMQEAAARQAVLAERARRDPAARLASRDAGAPP